MSVSEGQMLLHYRLAGKIGEGGMGQVWLAEDTKLGRRVALKLLAEAVTSDPERLARLDREAKVLASLNHPNIAAIHDLQHDGARHFLVLELVEGEDLAQRMDRGALPADEAVGVALQIAEALEAAHERHIIHRDLKPANVKITPDGRVKVLDFGLAKVWGVDERDPNMSLSPTITAYMTQVGTILGTAAYMSPEQARGKPVDRRSDIWAFGVILYEMLTGERLFTGDTATDILGAIVHRAPDWHRLPEDTPPRLVRLLKRCLTHDQRERLRDIGEARYALAHMKDEPAQETTEPLPPAASAGMWKIAAGVLLVASLALAGWMALSPAESPRVIRASVDPPDGHLLAVSGGFAGPVRVSPDGRSLTFAARGEEGINRIFVRSLASGDARPVPGTEGGYRPFWSPDSKSLGFFSGGKLRRVALAGGAPLAVADATEGRGGTWSAEGVIVFAPTPNSPLLRVNAGGGETKPVTDLGHVDPPENSHREPRLLPDGRKFLFEARDRERWKVYAGDLDGGEPVLLTTTGCGVDYAQGYLLFLQGSTLVAQRFDAETLILSGDPLPVAEDIVTDNGYGIGVFSASPDGVLAYLSGGAARMSVTWMGADGESLGTVGPSDAYEDLALSPDGKHAVVSVGESDGLRDLWLIDMDNGTRTRLTFTAPNEPALHRSVVWSPDGTEVVFASNRSGTNDLYRKSVAGLGNAELLLDAEENLWSYAWSPDGRYLIYGQERAEHKNAEDLFALPMDGKGDPIRLLDTPFSEWPAAVSPDGRWLAYGSPESGRREVYVAPFPGMGGRWQVSTEGGNNPRWSPDGRRLYFLGPTGLMAAPIDASSGTVRVGAVTRVLKIERTSDFTYYSVSPEGDRFLILLDDTAERSKSLSIFINWKTEVEAR